MAIKVATSFNVQTALPIDERLVLSKSDMASMNDNVMPDTYLATCTDDGQLYLYNKTNEADPTLGKFRLFEAGEGEEIHYFESKQDWETAKINGELEADKYYGYPEIEETPIQEDINAKKVIYDETKTSLGANAQAAIDKLYLNNNYTESLAYSSYNWFSENVSSGEYAVTYLSPNIKSVSNTNDFLYSVNYFLKNTVPTFVTNHGSHISKLYKRVINVESAVSTIQTKITEITASISSLSSSITSILSTLTDFEKRISALEGGSVLTKLIKATLTRYDNSTAGTDVGTYGALIGTKFYQNGTLIKTLDLTDATRPQSAEITLKPGSTCGLEFSRTTGLSCYGGAVANGVESEIVKSVSKCYFSVPNTTDDLAMTMWYSSWVDNVVIQFPDFRSDPINVITGSIK